MHHMLAMQYNTIPAKPWNTGVSVCDLQTLAVFAVSAAGDRGGGP
jgi:hypothetical protein